VARAANCVGEGYPARFETYGGKLGREEFADRSNAGQVESPAADVDCLLEESDLLDLVSSDVIANPLLGPG
jgi:hypothetical protein